MNETDRLFKQELGVVRREKNPIPNPYLAECEALPKVEMDPVFSMGDFKGYDINRRPAVDLRNILVKKYAWAIPNAEAIEAIAKYSPIIEMGAGTGYWASLIAQAGANILCYDREPYKSEQTDGRHHLVSKGEPDIIKNHPGWTLMLCWPPYSEPFARDCLVHYKGDIVIYIGEGSGGCTGDDDFHELLNKDFTEIESIKIPRWWGINDRLEVYKRDGK